MPALRLLGRRFSLGSDDLALPALAALALRLACCVALAVAHWTLAGAIGDCGANDAVDADGTVPLRTARALSAALGCELAASSALLATLFAHSLRGTIVDDEQRRRIPGLLKTLTIMVVVEGATNAAASAYVFRATPECPGHERLGHAVMALRGAVLAIWFGFAVYFTCGWLAVSNKRAVSTTDYLRFDEAIVDGSSSSGSSIDGSGLLDHASDEEGMSWSVTRTDWERRCRRWCCWFQLLTCNLFGNGARDASDETYRHVANVMARFFKGMDVVPSDLVSALFLLRAEQRARETAAVQAIIRSRLHSNLHASLDAGPAAADAPSPSPFHSADSFRSWLWSENNLAARARTRIRVEHFESSHVALDDDARALLSEAAHFAPFMLGIYGKLLFTYMNLLTGPCSLMCPCLHSTRAEASADGDGRRSRLPRRPTNPEDILDDDCCSLNYSALRVSTAGRLDPLVVFANFGNRPHQSPYSITVDRETRTVVVAIRGTLSAADMLIDAIMTPKPLAELAKFWGFEDLVDATSHAHGGMLLTATYIREDLERRRILHTILFGVQADGGHGYGTTQASRPAAQTRSFGDLHRGESGTMHHDLRRLPDCRGYKLKLVGHSLGAGVAGILSLLLKPLVPGLTALLYSPPGCIFDEALAQRSEAWIHAVFVGSDLVPHASWRSLMKLRGQMLECLRRSKVNKPKAFQSALVDTHADDLLYREDEVPDTFARRQLALRIERLKAQTERTDFLNRTPMYAPGRLLHLMRTETVAAGCCSSRDHFLPVWIADRRALDEFVISRRMALDHLPNLVAEVVAAVARDHAADAAAARALAASGVAVVV